MGLAQISSPSLPRLLCCGHSIPAPTNHPISLSAAAGLRRPPVRPPPPALHHELAVSSQAAAHMSAPRLCKGAIQSSPPPCWSRKLVLQAASAAAASSCVPREAAACRWSVRLLRASPPSFCRSTRRVRWAIKTMADDNSDNSGNSTRLFSAIQSYLKKLSSKLNKLRKGFPVKILFFLIGFYCATAFATVIGQTGDWDILSAGLAVAIVEVIGALMYRASFAFLGRMKNMVAIFNYWKAGLTLGLFLDSFKYEVDEFLESCNPFNFEINNIFTGLW